MPNWWCGPKLRVPKWIAPTIEGARTSFRRRMGTINNQDGTFRRRLRTLSENDFGNRFRDSIRRGRRTMSLRNLNRSRSDWTLRRTMSFRDSLHFRRRDSVRRRDTTLRKRRTTADIRIIRRSFGRTSASEPNLSTSCSAEDGNEEGTELDEMTKQADNLRREYEQMKFQEKWRDDMLLKLHQQNLTLSAEEMQLASNTTSFNGVKRRADALLDQIRVLIRKFLLLSQGDPGLVEACFQIVQEEERRDEEAAQCKEEKGFITPDRPKKWKDKILTELRKVPFLRVENTPKQDRIVDRNWLALHMELLSQHLREDLNILKGLFSICHSLDSDVAQFFVDIYYEYLTQHIQDIVSPGLRHNEIIQLLSWLTEHKAEMKRFNVSFIEGVSLEQAAENIVPEHTRKELEQSYLKTVHSNVKHWAKDALQKEREDWKSEDSPPKQDKDGYLYTEFPVHLFDLLRQNLDVAREISTGTYKALLGYCLDEVRNIVQHYAAAVKVYIPTRSVSTTPPSSPQPSPKSAQLVKKIRKTVEPHLSTTAAEEKRSQLNKPKFYVQFSVAALNNFETIIEHSQLFNQQRPQGEKKNPKQTDEDEDDFTYSLNMMRRLAKECFDKFMNDLFAEIKPLLKLVGTKQWFVQNGTSCIGEVCDIITAYTFHLRRQFTGEWREKIEQYMLQEYTKSFSRRTVCITCKNSKERQNVAEQILWECDQIENTLASLQKEAEVHISIFNMLRQMAEVIHLSDKQTIVLEVTSLVMKHPELTRRQLKAILRLRGDLKKAKIKKFIYLSTETDHNEHDGD
ncbi:exocyst complex component 3-like isoform X2 [Lytechinus variegatus]|uniref:exocyst complex component 3-like isoform X2 n=1 Tax=Lytechinus variegatus TaxID=7654 RepID=UPI001BB1DCA4|nr:exocyst complex component 3-like isoform X2 [Lytechinus variegatus]